MANQLKEVHFLNQRALVDRKYGKTDYFAPIVFFWPSFSAFRERFSLKILVVGDKQVGKTALIHRYLEGKYTTVPQTTELRFKTIELHGHMIELQIMETDFATLRTKNPFYLQPHACLICYDITDINSFQTARKSLKLIRLYTVNVVSFLVGTKADQGVKKAVSNKPLSPSVSIIETSAKDNVNVTECFLNCAKTVFKSLAWPNYVPSEQTLRWMVGLPEISDEKITMHRDEPKCIVQ